MLRYRAASLLILFFLLAAALHGRLQAMRWELVAGMAVLICSYIVATCLNDVFDYEVDRVNHPTAKERPLVTGAATVRELVALAVILAVVAIIIAALIGPLAVAAVAVSLIINVLYSAPPVRLCSRALAAAPVLAFAYVAVPYAIGLASAGVLPGAVDVRTVLAFMVLFAGRMLLKDFRDRRGDAMFGKRTFLLAYGKGSTVLTVCACVVAGDAILLTALPANAFLIVALESFFAAIVFELYRLSREDDLVHIARGARMGNAVVLTWLGYALLSTSGAASTELGVFVIAIAALFWVSYLLPAPAAPTTAASTREPSAAEPARAS
jgi:4-hydroxybenzoate polyprenyltransferase